MRAIRDGGATSQAGIVGAAIAVGVLLGACGDGGNPGAAAANRGDAGSPQTTGGEAGVDAKASGSTNLNPDGIPYPTPTAGYGIDARKGKTAGSIISNFLFFGYPNADESKGLQRIALADFYDPCGKRYKLLHLSVAAVWCEPCNEETLAFVASKAQLDSEKVVLAQALSDGPTKNVPATTADLNYWVSENKSNFTEMLDPNLANLGVFFDAAAVPWNADIDPRTMEILDDGTGYAGTVTLELQAGLAAIAMPPDYPIASQCK